MKADSARCAAIPSALKSTRRIGSLGNVGAALCFKELVAFELPLN
jgi:hypothetical protein